MYYDLNLPIDNYQQQPLPPDSLELLLSCIEDGYTGVAINNHFSNITLSKAHPISYDILDKKLEERKSLSNNTIISQQKFKQLSRITITVNDMKFLQQINDNNKILKTYDIIAVEPQDEKIFHSLCIDYEYYDIITFNLTKRLPFHLKYPPIKEAIKKGKMFEINYSQALEDQSIRRMMMANAINLINYTKGQNLIFSSNCKNQLYHRSPFDLASLGINLGLKRDQAFFAVSKNAENCVRLSSYRKTFKGTLSLATPAEKSLFKEKQMQLNLIKKTKKMLIQQKQQQQKLREQKLNLEVEKKEEICESANQEQNIQKKDNNCTDVNLQQKNEEIAQIDEEIVQKDENIEIEKSSLQQIEIEKPSIQQIEIEKTSIQQIENQEGNNQIKENKENQENNDIQPKKILPFTIDEG